MKSILKCFALLLFLSSCVETEHPSLTTLWQDYLAKKEIKNEKYEEALQKYYKIIEVSPEFYQLHSNVGILLNMIQKPEEALKSLQYALKLSEENNDLIGQFSVQYNLGVYFGLQKNVEQALTHYQAALEIVPNSKEIKTNIELLIQQQQKQNKQGQGEGDSKSDSKDQNKSGDDNQNKDQNKNDKEDKDKKDDKDKQDEKPKEDQKRENSPKYKPRPFQGEQLSEGDVKKILGELRNQEQKIRANFDKKEKGKSKKNEKDW